MAPSIYLVSIYGVYFSLYLVVVLIVFDPVVVVGVVMWGTHEWTLTLTVE